MKISIEDAKKILDARVSLFELCKGIGNGSFVSENGRMMVYRGIETFAKAAEESLKVGKIYGEDFDRQVGFYYKGIYVLQYLREGEAIPNAATNQIEEGSENL